MDKPLPRLRNGLEIFPSPIPEKPGLLFRDPLRYTGEILIIPPLLAAGLSLFDGVSTGQDVQQYISALAGEMIPHDIVQSLIEVLQSNGFLESEEFERMKAKRHAEFAAAQSRVPAHSGSGYPDQAESLRQKLDEYLHEHSTPAGEPIIGLAAPHVSPWGGWRCYAAAYGRLSGAAKPNAAQKTVVILGTSHYGEPERFGLTRKSFTTPLGEIKPNLQMIDWIASRAGDAAIMEDYCHSIEHSIEFQCIFLQQMLGSDFKIAPILCGPFAKAILTGAPPESDERVKRFLETLSELQELHSQELFWVLGIDLAHIGKRYGDDIIARADRGAMLEVREQDADRLSKVCEGHSEEFFDLVKPKFDRLKWCGFSPLYTFLRAVPRARGETIRYDQWNIDEQSVVSFAAMEFKSK